MSDRTKSLHDLYVLLTGRPTRWDMSRLHFWERYLAHYNEEDLRLVVSHLRWQIKSGRNYAPCLWFQNLICDLDRFDEHLGDARAALRNKIKHEPKEQVQLEAGIQPARPKDNFRPIGDVIKAMRAAVENQNQINPS